MKYTNKNIAELERLIADINVTEIKAHDTEESLKAWTESWRKATAECIFLLFMEFTRLGGRDGGKEDDIKRNE